MLRPVEFIKRAGLIGGGSVVLSLLTFGVGIFEHQKGRNVGTSILIGIGIVLFLYGAYRAWEAEHEEVLRLYKPNPCPVVRVARWEKLDNGSSRASESEAVFILQNASSVEAYDLAIENFPVGKFCTGSSGCAVVATGLGSLLPIWIELVPGWNSSDLRWQLKDAKQHSFSIRMIYRDYRNCWYSSTQEVEFDPKSNAFNFGAPQHEYCGIKRPSLTPCTPRVQLPAS